MKRQACRGRTPCVDLRTAISRLVQFSSDDEAARLRLDVDRLVAVDRVHDHRRIEPRRIAAREAAVAVRRPLHRRAHAVAVAEIDVVAHADLVAVIDDRRAGKRQQQRVHQLDLAPVVVHQRRQPPADAEIDARARIVGVGRPQIVALDVGDHFERQLVVVAQEQRPLAVRRECPASAAGCRRSGSGLPARSPCRCAASAGSDRPCGIRRRRRNRR